MNAFENPGRGEIVIYHGPDGGVTLDVRLEKETIWLSQKQRNCSPGLPPTCSVNRSRHDHRHLRARSRAADLHGPHGPPCDASRSDGVARRRLRRCRLLSGALRPGQRRCGCRTNSLLVPPRCRTPPDVSRDPRPGRLCRVLGTAGNRTIGGWIRHPPEHADSFCL